MIPFETAEVGHRDDAAEGRGLLENHTTNAALRQRLAQPPTLTETVYPIVATMQRGVDLRHLASHE